MMISGPGIKIEAGRHVNADVVPQHHENQCTKIHYSWRDHSFLLVIGLE